MSDDPLLQLFPNASALETPTPGARAYLAAEPLGGGVEGTRALLVKRLRTDPAREVRLLDALGLSHGGIVRTRRVLKHGEYIYVVRDVVRGKNLRQTLGAVSGGRPSPELLRLMTLPLLDALAYAHEQGTAHGGVSAENVLISDEGRVQLSDFGTADPGADRHQPFYHGQATPRGDVRALAHLVSAYLPVTGAFASLSVRGRIEGILSQADTVTDLREVVNALERLAASTPGAPLEPHRRMPTLEMPAVGAEPSLPFPTSEDDPLGVQMPPTGAPIGGVVTGPPLSVSLSERTLRLTQGTGDAVTLSLRNDGPLPLQLRMIATQHAWLNVQAGNWQLPLAIEPGTVVPLAFNVSAARLSPGEYRSEVYLVYSDGTPDSDNPQTWVKHTTEVRVQVDNSASSVAPSSPGGKPPFPPDAPRVPVAPGCGAVLLVAALGLVGVACTLFAAFPP